MVEAHVVSEFTVGNTKIKIADNICRRKTACDVERLLTQIAKRAQRYFSEPTSTESHESKEDKKIPTYRGEHSGGDYFFGLRCYSNRAGTAGNGSAYGKPPPAIG